MTPMLFGSSTILIALGSGAFYLLKSHLESKGYAFQ